MKNQSSRTVFSLAAMFSGAVFAQGHFPLCQGSDMSQWHNCIGEDSVAGEHVYKGEFRQGKYHGQGTASYASGDKYVGEWKDGMFHGQGTYTFVTGEKYVGEFKDDNYNGRGTFTHKDGEKYVGEFKNGKYAGRGILTMADGKQQEGLFEDAIGKDSYEAYDRVYTSDIDAYVGRETAFVTWTTTYTVQPVFSTYTAVISGSMRYVPEQDGVGPMVIQRSYLPDIATFNGDTEDFFEQDYQLDVVLPATDGSKHGYANWRDLKSAGLEDEDTGVQNLLIDGLETYYQNLDTVCAAGGF